MAHTTRPRNKPVPLSLILFTLLILVLVLVAVWFWIMVPRMAQDSFGLPASYLTPFQRFSYSGQILLAQKDLLSPRDSNGVPITFSVEPGESVNSIAFRLEQEGVIRDAPSFRLFLIYAGLDTGIQAGTYELNPALSAIEIAYSIQDATSREVKFVLLGGWRAEEVAAALVAYGLPIDVSKFMDLVSSPQKLDIPSEYKSLSTLEGFLGSGEYMISRTTDEKTALIQFVQGFDEALTPELRSGFAQQGLSLEEAVILASIVQREAMDRIELPTIASVFYNRLAIGMKLDSDPTVQYAVGTDTHGGPWWKNSLTRDDLNLDSPYNTYLYPGLPPGAICNPSREALKAVAFPAQTPYLYFRAACDGSFRHKFAETYEEHLQNACP